jgi:hypothetical protein
VQFPTPIELYAPVRFLKPETVVESGVSSGISSAHILMGLALNRRRTLYSVDFPIKLAGKKRERGTPSWAIPFGKSTGWAIPSDLKRRWKLFSGKSEDILPGLLNRIRRVDFFCHDSPNTPRHLAFELSAVKKHLVPGSVVIADNTEMNPIAFRETAKELGAQVIFRKSSKSLAAFRLRF